MKRIILFIAFLFLSIFSKAENNTMDSLKLALKNAKHDTTRCKILDTMADTEQDDKIWPKYNEQLKIICETNLKKYTNKNPLHTFYLRYFATYLNNIGLIYSNQGNPSEALNYYHKSLKIRTEINDKKGQATSFIAIGIIYSDQNNISQALNYLYESLKKYEDVHDKTGIARCLFSIVSVLYKQGDIPQALNYLYKSLKIHEKINDKEGIATSLNSIAVIYSDQGNDSEALNYYLKSLKIYEEIKDKKGLASSLNNIGNIYDEQGNVSEALNYYYKSLKKFEEIEYKEGVNTSLCNIAVLLHESSKISEAKKLAERSLKLAKELGYPELIRNSSNILSLIYKKLGNWKGAYQMQVLYKQMADSMDRMENKKATIQSQYKYEYEKKVVADSIKKKEEQKVFNAQLKQEKTQRYALLSGVVLLIGFGGFMVSRFRKEQKQKKIIEKQKDIITHKNQEINQSIDYALHIQNHILPHYKITDLANDSFLLYQPKDIVSGDFYWLEENNNKVYMAVADCTGHGIPGAFMSMLGTSLLNEIFNKHDVETAADFLNTLNKLIKLTFKLHLVEDKKINDGMDIAFCILDANTNELQYAGANRPLWLLKEKELVETKANKQAIGGTTAMDYEFSNHTIQLKKGDSIYLTSDGYADQFGGEKGKKMMTKVLKQKLEEINSLPMQEQQQQLLSFYNTWKGDNEQVDDVTIIGVKV